MSLYYAAYEGSVEVVRFLLEKGANVNVVHKSNPNSLVKITTLTL